MVRSTGICNEKMIENVWAKYVWKYKKKNSTARIY